MEVSPRPHCVETVKNGPRTGLPCSVYAGSGKYSDYCFHHVPETLIDPEDIRECHICLQEKPVSWISSCRCKCYCCKECLVEYQNTVKRVTPCTVCMEPMNDTEILFQHRPPRRERPVYVPPPLPPLPIYLRYFQFSHNEDGEVVLGDENTTESSFIVWPECGVWDLDIVEEPLKALTAVRMNVIAKITGNLTASGKVKNSFTNYWKYEQYMSGMVDFPKVDDILHVFKTNSRDFTSENLITSDSYHWRENSIFPRTVSENTICWTYHEPGIWFMIFKPTGEWGSGYQLFISTKTEPGTWCFNLFIGEETILKYLYENYQRMYFILRADTQIVERTHPTLETDPLEPNVPAETGLLPTEIWDIPPE